MTLRMKILKILRDNISVDTVEGSDIENEQEVVGILAATNAIASLIEQEKKKVWDAAGEEELREVRDEIEQSLKQENNEEESDS